MFWNTKNQDELERLRKENTALKAKIESDVAQIELLHGVKEVAELQSSYALQQLEDQQRMYKQWINGAHTIDNIRHAVAVSSGKLSDQHSALSESVSSFDQIHVLLSHIAGSLAHIDDWPRCMSALTVSQTLDLRPDHLCSCFARGDAAYIIVAASSTAPTHSRE